MTNLVRGLRFTSLAIAFALSTSAALAQSGNARTLTIAPVAGLLTLDPSFTTTSVTNNHAHYVFDMLYGLDSNRRAVPQMVDVVRVAETIRASP